MSGQDTEGVLLAGGVPGSIVSAKPRMRRPSESLGEDLRRVLRTELLKGPCTVTGIARLFALHPRTFSRHLADEGESFQRIADEVRFRIACDLLANNTMALGQITAVLMYSEPSAFTRAFRRWSGQSPSTWRDQHVRTGRRRDAGHVAADRPTSPSDTSGTVKRSFIPVKHDRAGHPSWQSAWP
jgi:AraC-like DNA-binding protein